MSRHKSLIINIVFYTLLVAAAAGGAIFVILPELQRKEGLREQRDAIASTNAMLSAQATALQRQRQSLDSENPDCLLDQAHRQGLAVPGETIFIFREDP